MIDLDGPPGIVTQCEVDETAPQVGAFVERRAEAAASEIACHPQPGLDLARSLTGAPLIGIGDAGVFTALALADLFGVAAIPPLLIRRRPRALHRFGVGGRRAGEVALEAMSVANSGHGKAALRTAASRLRGCAAARPRGRHGGAADGGAERVRRSGTARPVLERRRTRA